MIKQFPIHFMPPTALKPYYQNVKQHDKRNVGNIAKLLKKYDFDQPIVVDAEHVIIKGHGRYMAALYLNKKLVPVIVRDDLTPAQVQASRIADNRIFELGQINDDMVRAELHDFVAEGGKGAEEIFDFLKPTKEKEQGMKTHVETSADDNPAPTFKGSMQVCPKCNYTEWVEKS